MSGMPYLGLISFTWMNFMRGQLKSHLLCKVTLHLCILCHSSLPSILRGLDHRMTPRLFLRPFQLLKYWNTAMSFGKYLRLLRPLGLHYFTSPRLPRHVIQYYGITAWRGGGGAPEAPSPMVWHPSRLVPPLQDQSYNACTVLLLVTLHYGQCFLALPIQLDFEHYVLFIFAFSRA